MQACSTRCATSRRGSIAPLRRRAKREGRSLNEVTLLVLAEGLGLTLIPVKRRDLSSVAGRWEDDPEFDRALAAQHGIDAELWR